jgi:hypothetical protein
MRLFDRCAGGCEDPDLFAITLPQSLCEFGKGIFPADCVPLPAFLDAR